MDTSNIDESIHKSVSLDFSQTRFNASFNKSNNSRAELLKKRYSSYPIANYQSCIQKKESLYSEDSIGIVLAKRKNLFSKRKKIADIMFILSTFGIVLMIIMVELLFSNPLKFLYIIEP